MREIDKALVLEFKKRLPRESAEKLKKLIVFGSRTKGAKECRR